MSGTLPAHEQDSKARRKSGKKARRVRHKLPTAGIMTKPKGEGRPELVDASACFGGGGGGSGGGGGGGGDKGCRCGRTKCLKQYCACFRNDMRCKPNECVCTDCRNDGKHEPERMMAVRAIRLNSKEVRYVSPACSRPARVSAGTVRPPRAPRVSCGTN